jgi:hypothetical protein
MGEGDLGQRDHGRGRALFAEDVDSDGDRDALLGAVGAVVVGFFVMRRLAAIDV